MTLGFKWGRHQTASLEERFATMAKEVRERRPSRPEEARVTDRKAVRAEIEAWSDSRREVNGRIL